MKLVPINNFKKKVRKMSDLKLVKTLNHTFRFSANLKEYDNIVDDEIERRGLKLHFTVEGKIGRWTLQ
jgi:hypothetical protein